MPKFIDYAGPNITKISQKLKDFWQSVDQLWKNSNRQIIDLDDKDLIYRLVKSLEDKL
jgi:hypothetical protein